jgi:hypothetical protein
MILSCVLLAFCDVHNLKDDLQHVVIRSVYAYFWRVFLLIRVLSVTRVPSTYFPDSRQMAHATILERCLEYYVYPHGAVF